ncbi:hypothetical protein PIB30_070542 [Stylosanthes scabra]|uniref:Aminotransferase-like plant mobile domain-containing protein n=1 Tax=Stylosanthes scabra TaxID=79078 RepID=A0ABU6VLY3_9FABA|nr:hypothetical protein [Stylosanthes scabra]
MERGRQELRVAANRASIGALDQKLSRPEVGVRGGRIDSEPVLQPILNQLPHSFSCIRCGVSNAGSIDILVTLALSPYPISRARTSPYRIEILPPLCHELSRLNRFVAPAESIRDTQPLLLLDPFTIELIRVRLESGTRIDSFSIRVDSTAAERVFCRDLRLSFFIFLTPFNPKHLFPRLSLHFFHLSLTQTSPLFTFSPHSFIYLSSSFGPYLTIPCFLSTPIPFSFFTNHLHSLPLRRCTFSQGPTPPCENASSKEILKSYLDIFSKLPVLKPKYLSEGLLPEDKYEVFWKLVDQQGLRPLLFMKERYYPRMMRVVATSLWLADKLNDAGEGEFYLRFWIGGVTYTITLEELASLWGLPNDGIRFKGGHLRPKEYDHWSGKHSQSVLNVSYIGGGKYSVGELSTDHCLLHYMLSYLWLPRNGNHGALTEEDVFIMRAMVEETELSWPYLLAYRFMHYFSSSIFEHFEFDLSDEEVIHVTEENAITSRSLNKMGRGIVVDRKGKKNKAVAENAPSQFGTGLDSQITPELMEKFAEKMHSVSIDWDKKMERVDKRLKVIESRIASQAEEFQSLEASMNTHFSRRTQSGV